MFSDLQLKVAAEQAIQTAHANMAKLALFAKSYSELNGVPGQSIAIPVYDLSAASDFVAGTNDYGTSTQEVGGTVLTLDKHYVKSVSITDRQLAETGINWVRDTTIALVDNLTRKANKEVFGLLDATSGEQLTATCPALSSTKTVAELYKYCSDNTISSDIPVDRCIVVLNPENYAKVLGNLDANVFGGTEAVRDGVVPGLYGFKAFVCSTFLPTGIKGSIIMDEAIGTACRYLAPMTPGAYPMSFSATDPDNGLTLGFRRFENLNTGSDIFACDLLMGMKVLSPKKIINLV